jgi:hypothetical protein
VREASSALSGLPEAQPTAVTPKLPGLCRQETIRTGIPCPSATSAWPISCTAVRRSAGAERCGWTP